MDRPRAGSSQCESLEIAICEKKLALEFTSLEVERALDGGATDEHATFVNRGDIVAPKRKKPHEFRADRSALLLPVGGGNLIAEFRKLPFACCCDDFLFCLI